MKNKGICFYCNSDDGEEIRDFGYISGEKHVYFLCEECRLLEEDRRLKNLGFPPLEYNLYDIFS